MGSSRAAPSGSRAQPDPARGRTGARPRQPPKLARLPLQPLLRRDLARRPVAADRGDLPDELFVADGRVGVLADVAAEHVRAGDVGEVPVYDDLAVGSAERPHLAAPWLGRRDDQDLPAVSD